MCGAKQLQVYDKEPENCRSKLFEYNVTFPPRFVKLVLSFTVFFIVHLHVMQCTVLQRPFCPSVCLLIMSQWLKIDL